MRTLKGEEVRALIPNLVDRPAGEHETYFYDGFPLSVYEAIEARRSEVMQLVQEALEEYLGDDLLASSDGSFFPDRSKLTGYFYIEEESYSIIRRVEPRLYGVSLQAHFFEHGTPPVEYLGLEVGLIYDPLSSTISHSGVDSSAL